MLSRYDIFLSNQRLSIGGFGEKNSEGARNGQNMADDDHLFPYFVHFQRRILTNISAEITL